MKKENFENIIKALAYTIDAKDRYTAGHSQRVADYSREIARRMGKSKEEQDTIYYAGLLHDIGKIRVPEDLINKPGSLDSEEFKKIQLHPVVGFHTLKNIYDDPQISYAAKFHHERFDGLGYPNGLSGKNIPEIARIICVADTYDAMASSRSYRDCLSQETIKKEIENCSGGQFDPEIAKIMIEMIDEDKNYEMRQHFDENIRIMICDEDAENISFSIRYIEGNSIYKVEEAFSTREALKKIKEKGNIKALIIELELLEKDSDFLENLKKICNIPVIVMSEKKDCQTLKKVSDMDVSDFLMKPFVKDILLETIYGVINTF